MQTQEKSSFLRTIFKICPYTHLWQAIKTAYKEKKLPASAKNGAMIALLGLFLSAFLDGLFQRSQRQRIIVPCRTFRGFRRYRCNHDACGLAKNDAARRGDCNMELYIDALKAIADANRLRLFWLLASIDESASPLPKPWMYLAIPTTMSRAT